MASPGLGRKAVDWLDERLEVRRLSRSFFERRIPSGVGWIHTLGSATLFLLLVQILTGTFLAFYYVPSVEHAYGSTRYITETLPLGWFVRGLHRWGASLAIIVLFLHLVRVFFMGAYKYPRELTWVAGVLLLVVAFAFGFTGYLLPLDQKAYWASVVGLHIAETAPVVGEYVALILRGGVEVGNQTLSRFYASHVLILPGMLIVLAAIHVAMVVKQGISAPPWGKTARMSKEDYRRVYDESKGAGERFYEHLIRDAVVSFGLLLLLYYLAVRYGAPLEERADPATVTYVPRPEWYFYFLFELLWLFPGKWTVVATFYIPALAVVLLLLLPFIDRGPARSPVLRPLTSGVGAAVLAGMAVLTYQGMTAPPPPGREETAKVTEGGKPPAPAPGAAVYARLGCAACHAIQGKGGAAGPDLSRAGAKRDAEWLKRFIRNPKEVNAASVMPGYANVPAEDLEAMARYLAELR